MQQPTNYLITFLLIITFACSQPVQEQTAETAIKKPNIILIMADDVGYSDISPYGGEINTPNLYRLATNGLRYTQFYNTARCCPTRASLITGLHPHQAGVGHMMEDRGTPAYAGNLSNQAVTIAEVLGANGYNTYMSGKWHLTPGHDEEKLSDQHNWPVQRGFQRFFGTIHGAGSFYDPNSLSSGNELIMPTEDFYYTDAISDTAVKYIQEHPAEQPFFMYVAYTAAHWPMHALPEDIAKYEGRYDMGWDSLRQERYQRMIEMGLIDENWPMSPPNPEERTWESADMKAWHARCMEVYAAMLDNMDQGIGRMLTALEAKGELENTLIFYLQDNGACAEEYGMYRELPEDIDSQPLQPMEPGEFQYNMEPKFTRDGRPVRVGKGVMPGPADTYIGYDQRWANASNTPFRMFKHWAHEGGIATPLIVHWPEGISAKGEYRQQASQLPDIMATCVEAAGAKYPQQYNGNTIKPMEGKSLVASFANQPLERKALYWEHEGNRAIRQGKWKLVSRPDNKPRFWNKTEDLPLEEWELYDLEADRTEINNLADQHPEKVQEMAALWQAWAKRVGAVPMPE